jgi:hypothetical protein
MFLNSGCINKTSPIQAIQGPFCASNCPITFPSENPSKSPSKNPSENPSQSPSENPSKNPSKNPSENPSESPTRYCFLSKSSLQNAVNDYINQGCSANSTCVIRQMYRKIGTWCTTGITDMSYLSLL